MKGSIDPMGSPLEAADESGRRSMNPGTRRVSG
jgi:hypothetical protein